MLAPGDEMMALGGAPDCIGLIQQTIDDEYQADPTNDKPLLIPQTSTADRQTQAAAVLCRTQATE